MSPWPTMWGARCSSSPPTGIITGRRNDRPSIHELNNEKDETIDFNAVRGASLLHVPGKSAVDGHRPVEPRSEHQERGSKLDHGDQHGQVAAREYQDL